VAAIVYCPSCGRRLASDDPACPTCSKIAGARAGQSAPVRTLVVQTASGTERRVGVADDLGEPLSIGRDATNWLRLEDAFVSRHHARIERRDGDLLFVDLGSRNGSRLNGVRVNGAARLHAGDEIAIGDAKIRCLSGAPMPAHNTAFGQWHGALRAAGVGMVVLALAWLVNRGGTFTSANSAAPTATARQALAGSSAASQSATATPSPAPATSEQAKAEAVELLGAAGSQRQQGQLGLSLELARQALGKWPDYREAQSFLAELAPQATAQAQAAATAQAETNRPPAIQFAGTVDPDSTIRMGQKLVIQLDITNRGQRDLTGFQVFALGLQRFTLTSILPGGTYDGAIIRTGLVVPPGETGHLFLTTYPKQVGFVRVSFYPQDLKDDAGRSIQLNADITVVP
jgi:pyruvate/2-oxoglutarate dehydrogenase complex dihydrolipoamide acyltransferase (E2) component